VNHAKLASLILIGSIVAITGPSLAQQQSSTAAPAAPTAAASPAAAAPGASAPEVAASTSTPVASTPAAKPPAASKTVAAANMLSADILKRAKQAGYYTRVRSGQTFFCKKESQLGTRFVTEKCLDENQLAMVLERNQAQRDQLMNVTCGGGGACGGGK